MNNSRSRLREILTASSPSTDHDGFIDPVDGETKQDGRQESQEDRQQSDSYYQAGDEFEYCKKIKAHV